MPGTTERRAPTVLLPVLLVLGMATGLSACGGGGEPSADQSEDVRTLPGMGVVQAARETALATMVRDVRMRYPDVEGVDAARVEAMIADGAVLVDVRSEEERAVSRIPGSITREAYLADPGRYGDRPVVAYCTVGERSARFAQEQAGQGRTILNFEGSILAWTHHGGALVGPDGPTRRLHVYGSRWDLAAVGYETTW